MRCLLLTDGESDFSAVLESCGIPITRMSLEDAAKEELSIYDTYAVLAYGKVLDPRLRVRLEAESAKGKRLFTEGLNSWGDIYSEEIPDTTRSRLVVVANTDDGGIPGLETGDLLDDGSNHMMRPWYTVPGQKPLLVYREHIVAHSKWDADWEESIEEVNSNLFS